MKSKDQILLEQSYQKVLKESIPQKYVENIPDDNMSSEDMNLASRLWKAAQMGPSSEEWRNISKENPKYEKMLIVLKNDWDDVVKQTEFIEREYMDPDNIDPLEIKQNRMERHLNNRRSLK